MSEPYAIAIVVGREPPFSSHLGDRAIVHADGRMEGFVGGSCSREIVRREAVDAIRSGEPRLVRITPEEHTCASEGSVEVYIEPQMRKRKLIVAGLTPVAQALADIAPALGFSVERFVENEELCDVDGMTIDTLAGYVDELDPGERVRSAAVVASQGHYDDSALAALLRHDFAYVGLVASRKRGSRILEELEAEGISRERLNIVNYPAGLAIGAQKPADVAISIFAQITALNAAARNGETAEANAGVS